MECQYCKHWHKVPAHRRQLDRVAKNVSVSIRKCSQTKKDVKSTTDTDCKFFELQNYFHCEEFCGWVPVLGCLNRQTKGICNCAQGEYVCDLTAGIDPIDLGGKPRPAIVKRNKPAEVVLINRRRPKLIKRKAS